MRLLLAQATLYVPTHGGENKGNRCLVEGLAARGHACRVVAPASGAQGPGSREAFLRELEARGLELRSSSEHADVFEQAGVEVHAVRDGRSVASYTRNQLADFTPDCTLIPSEDPGNLLLSTAMESAASPVVYLANTVPFVPFGAHAFWPSRVGTQLLQSATSIVTVSEFFRGYLRAGTGRDAIVLHFPVYGSGPFKRCASPPSGAATFVNPCAYKGLPIFMELARRLPDVSFMVVPTWGTTSTDRAALEQLPNVSIFPATDDIDEIFARSRLVVMPSLWAEGFPVTPGEAMLRGLPVVASDAGGLGEAKLGVDYILPVAPIERYERRLDERGLPVPVVPPQEIEPWIDAVTELGDRERYEEVSDASLQAAMAFVRSVSVEPFEAHFEELARSAAKPRKAEVIPDREATEAHLREQLRALTPERLSLLMRTLKERSTPSPADEPAEARLSLQQEGVWLAERLRPGTAVYNVPYALWLEGRLDRTALERSLGTIVARHEPLRTTFEDVAGSPVARLEPRTSFVLANEDLRELAAGDRAAAALELAAREARRPFDLARSPLLRATLTRVEEERHLLVLVAHHIAFDGWSVGVLLRELAELYEALAAGREPSVPDLNTRYSHYARGQRTWLDGPRHREQLAYWKNHLHGAPPLLELPTDHPRPPVRTVAGAVHDRVLPAELASSLRELSRREGVTLFTTLLTAYKTLLHRYTASDDIVVGSPAAARDAKDAELIGLFVNNLVLRTDLSGDPSFRELLARVRRTTAGGVAHQSVPFESLLAELQPARSTAHTPVFQTLFALQNPLGDIPELPHLEFRPVELDTGSSNYDLSLHVFERGEALRARLEYSTDLFDAETVARLAEHYETLLEAAVADPAEPISTLRILTANDRRQLERWNETAVAYERDHCLHELVEAQVERTPESEALVFEGESVTYRELNRRANRLAHHLARLGVGPEALVGVCLERSPELVIALLAIQKAGGAYVPLDPDYPPERLAAMVADAEPPVLVSDTRLAERLPASAGRSVLVDRDCEAIAREPDANPVSGARPENLAYVIYTSGSTGQPKGAMNTHQAIVNRILWMDDVYTLEPTDRVMQKTPFSFDVSVWEFFWPLVTGACMVIARPGGHREPDYLVDRIQAENVTTMHFVPSMARAFLEAADVERCTSLRQVMCSGEALTPDVQERFFSRSRAELHNLYGPTEAAVDVSAWRCERGSPRSTVPIGRPIANTQLYVLDRRLQPVPIGVPGELFIGGIAVGRGYLGKPELTAERFIDDPFNNRPRARLYRTGDRARWLADGNIEYLGRWDDQVKIRGHRIELGEIEATLNEHPKVAESVVVVRDDTPGDSRLVAWFVPALEPAPPASELRAHLGRTLPEAMLPSRFVPLDTVPLTASGKADRRALATRELAPSEPTDNGGVPRTPLETELVEIWEELIVTRPIGVADDFFELGGHSLLALRMLSLIRERFGVEVPARTIFQRPTVAGLADEIDGRRALPAEPQPELAPRERERYRRTR